MIFDKSIALWSDHLEILGPILGCPHTLQPKYGCGTQAIGLLVAQLMACQMIWIQLPDDPEPK